MKKILIFFLVLFFLNIYNNAWTSISNKIIVKVENEIITNYDIKNKILTDLLLSGIEINQSNINKYKSRALDALINLKLKEIELSKFDLKVEQRAVQNYLKSVFKDNTSKLKNTIQKNNLSYELFISEIKIDIKWRQFIYQIYNDKIKINDEEISEDLDLFIKQRQNISSQEIRISEIDFSYENEKQLQDGIKKIRETIEKEGFEKAVMKYSSSNSLVTKGDIGWVKVTSLSEKIYKAIKNLKINEISREIIQPNRVLFLKVTDKKKVNEEYLDKEKMKKDLIAKRTNELFSLYSKSHLSKLKNESFIDYK